MRSTLRRYAMAKPPSVHCISRQFLLGHLSCARFREVDLAPSTASLALDRVLFLLPLLLLLLLGLLGCPVSQVRTRPGTSRGIRWLRISPVLPWFLSCRSGKRCSPCTRLCNRGTVNPSIPSGSMHRFSSQLSSLCGTGNLYHRTEQQIRQMDITVACILVIEHLEL